MTIYEQTHKFEDIEQNMSQNGTLLLSAHRERFNRIKSCQHFFDFDDYMLSDLKETVAVTK